MTVGLIHSHCFLPPEHMLVPQPEASTAGQWEAGGCPGYLRDLLPPFHLPSVDVEEGVCREERMVPPSL